MVVEIDKSSGFCFGVVNAIKIAEESLLMHGILYCLGDIVHNEMEISRLIESGLKIISKEEYFKLKNCTVLIRAHGEPPETYEYAKANNVDLIDATCPVVLKLQERVKSAHKKGKEKNNQIIIFGKKGHAEVIGLNGQTNDEAIVINSSSDLDEINFSKPVTLFSQTTSSLSQFKIISEEIKQRSEIKDNVTIKDTICRQVSNRVPKIKKFIENYDLILFVSGEKSSNGKFLFNVCEENHKNARLISDASKIEESWFKDVSSVGICGATSTPAWLMNEVADTIKKLSDK